MILGTVHTVSKSAFTIEKNAKKKAPSDTGRLRSSIQTDFLSSGLIANIFSDVNYAIYVEYGTKAHRPPSSALKGWARRHNMQGLEYIIAKSIEQNGTKAQPFLVPSFEAERIKFYNSLKKVLRNMR